MRANRQRDRRTLIAILRSPTAQFLTLLCRRWAVWLVVNSCCEWHKARPNVTVVARSVCVSVCCSRTRTVPNRLNQSRCRLECVDSVSGGVCVTVNGFRTSRQHSVHAKEERPRTLRTTKQNGRLVVYANSSQSVSQSVSASADRVLVRTERRRLPASSLPLASPPSHPSQPLQPGRASGRPTGGVFSAEHRPESQSSGGEEQLGHVVE